MKNPITVERKKYLNGRASYRAKLGQVEAEHADKATAEALLLKQVDALAIKTLAVRALTDGRIAVLQCMGVDGTGALSFYLQRYDADGRSSGGTVFSARHWREAEERFLSELRSCGQLPAENTANVA